jgi:molybdopterin synthase catalytic subunit
MEIVTNKPVDASDVFRLIHSGNSGSVVFHFAVVRGTTGDRETSLVEFQPAKSDIDTKEELHQISEEIRKKWEVDDVLIIRAMGKLSVGDVMSLVAVSSPRSQAAFEGSHWGVDRLKEMKSIKKQETFKKVR